MSPARWVFAILAFGVLASCATGAGDGFARDVQKYRQELAVKPLPEPPETGVKILTEPDDARIFFDGKFVGNGAAVLDTSVAGTKTEVRVEAPAYRPQKFTLESKGQKDVLYVRLDPITGVLVLLPPPVQNSDFTVTVDGKAASPGALTVLIGFHTVAWRQFGYLPRAQTVVVGENQVTQLQLDANRAAFALTGPASSRRAAFNPDLVGPEGRLQLRFSASAPGSAKLTVRSGGDVVRTFDFAELSWSQSAVWDGRDDTGSPLGSGTYQVALSGAEPGGDENHYQEVAVTLNRALAGYLFDPAEAPTPEVLAEGLALLGLRTRGHAGFLDGSKVSLWPTDVWLVAGLARGWDFSLLGKATVGSEGVAGWGGALSVGTALGNLTENTSLKLLTELRASALDGAVVAASVSAAAGGKWRVSLAPGMEFAPNSTGWQASLASTVAWNSGPLTLVLSGTAATPQSRLGAEARWLLAPSGLTLTALASVHAYENHSWAMYGGLGLTNLVDTLDLASR